MEPESQVHVRTTDELEEWLVGAPTDEVAWVVVHKRHHPDHLPYPQVVEVLLAHGWIDSRIKSLDDDRSMLRITPRRAGSMWSRVNKEAIERLESEGRMTDEGQAAVDRAKADGSWTILDDVEALTEPADLSSALDRTPGARAVWEDYPPSFKKQCLWSLKSAKRDETRQRRTAAIVEAAAEGRRPTF